MYLVSFKIYGKYQKKNRECFGAALFFLGGPCLLSVLFCLFSFLLYAGAKFSFSRKAYVSKRRPGILAEGA